MDIMKMGSNPDYLGSWDLEELPGKKMVLTIKAITDRKVPNGNGKEELCTVAEFHEPVKPMILNITNKKTLVRLYKTKETEKLVGKRILVEVKQVKAFGDIHDALRISKNEPPAPAKAASLPKCEGCGNPIEAAHGMGPETLARYTREKYGKQLCATCATAENKKTEKGDDNNE